MPGPGVGHTRSRGPDSSYLLMPSVLSVGRHGGLCRVFQWSVGVCPSVAQFVQVSSDVNTECFQLENNFIICYHRAVISTRPTLITRPGTRERDFLLRKHPPVSTTHSVVLSPQGCIWGDRWSFLKWVEKINAASELSFSSYYLYIKHDFLYFCAGFSVISAEQSRYSTVMSQKWGLWVRCYDDPVHAADQPSPAEW